MSPEFRDLVGEEGTPEELERLRRVHDLLVSVEPPPELPRSLAKPPRSATPLRVLRLRPRVAAVAGLAAAAAIAIGFGIGYGVRGGGGGFSAAHVVPMHGLGRDAAAKAWIAIGNRDSDGNWALEMTVRKLPALPNGGWYELYLTKKGKPNVTCGTFRTGAALVRVRLTAPYDLREYDGWIVTAHVPGEHDRVLMTT
jgi:hypothetical protein